MEIYTYVTKVLFSFVSFGIHSQFLVLFSSFFFLYLFCYLFFSSLCSPMYVQMTEVQASTGHCPGGLMAVDHLMGMNQQAYLKGPLALGNSL